MSQNDRSAVSRRSFLGSAAACAGAGVLASGAGAAERACPAIEPPGEDFRIKNRRVKQSVMAWCYDPMPMEQLIDGCKKMGLHAMEGIDRKYYPRIKAAGMEISLVGSHGFKAGPTDPDNHAMCVEKLKEGIDVAAEVGSPSVITFTGMRVPGVSDERMTKNCIECFKKVIDYAEEKKIAICLEHLNTRDDSHPMKGHPGYFGDDVDLCADIIKAVDSPRMKLLFDIYHVQVMHGDVIRRLRDLTDLIGHYHTAGVPGRAEIDESQELNYPPIMKAILETGYTGYVAQEFIPEWEDKLSALRHGVAVCDV
jgi:hydroxypyruvate isomerase